jgi:hypothetical protein
MMFLTIVWYFLWNKYDGLIKYTRDLYLGDGYGRVVKSSFSYISASFEEKS